MYLPDWGCVHTLLTLYVYATGYNVPMSTRSSERPRPHTTIPFVAVWSLLCEC